MARRAVGCGRRRRAAALRGKERRRRRRARPERRSVHRGRAVRGGRSGIGLDLLTVRDRGGQSPKGRHGAPFEEPGGHPGAHRRHERRRRRGRTPHPRLRRAVAPRLARQAAHQQRHRPAQDLREDRPALPRRPDVPGRALRRGRRGGPRPLREGQLRQPVGRRPSRPPRSGATSRGRGGSDTRGSSPRGPGSERASPTSPARASRPR